MFQTKFLIYREDGSVKILTKGDNNSVDDRGLYAPGQLWLKKKDIVGRTRGYVSLFRFLFVLKIFLIINFRIN